MFSFDAIFLIKVMLFLYISAAIFSIIFLKFQKVANLIPNLICVLASITGAVASIMFIVKGDLKTVVYKSDMSVLFISLNVNIDGLSAFFILSLSVLVFCISIYSIGYLTHYYDKRNVGLFNFLYCGFILSMILVFMAGDMVFFLIAWEAMSLLSYFLVVFESENKENQKAGTLYIVMTHVATAFLLIAFMIIFGFTGSFDIFSGSLAIPDLAKNVIFVLLLIGFGTKAGIIPMHIWLPYAHPAAASNVSALMSGIMIKTAIYGLIRFLFGFLGVHNLWWGIVILMLGAVSAVLGVAYALMEHNIKRLLAYHSIENIGIILMGLGVSMIAYANGNMILFSLALIAALFHTFNHAVFKGGLFLGAGAIQYSTHTKDIEELGGLAKVMPFTAFFMLIFSLAICAIVPFNGFISEWLTYQSLFLNISSGNPFMNIISIVCVAALALCGALALACFVKLYGISFLGQPRSNHAQSAKEVPISMRVGMGVLTIICIIFGLFPLGFLKIIDRAIFAIAPISALDKLQGNFMFVYYPVSVGESAVKPIAIVLLVVALVIAILLISRIIGGKLKARKYGTWDCGYEGLNSRMQYSATGFSKPFRIIFRMLYRPGRELKIEEGSSPYHPSSMKYNVTTEKIFEKYFYYPFLRFIKRVSRKSKYLIQTGSIHIYLTYIFVTLLVLMLYSSVS